MEFKESVKKAQKVEENRKQGLASFRDDFATRAAATMQHKDSQSAMQGAYVNNSPVRSNVGSKRNVSVGHYGTMVDDEQILDKMEAYESKMRRAEILKKRQLSEMQQHAHSLTNTVDEKIYIRNEKEQHDWATQFEKNTLKRVEMEKRRKAKE